MTQKEQIEIIIKTLNSGAWSFILFMKDSQNINEEDKVAVTKAVSSGLSCATSIKETYNNWASNEILHDLGVSVEFVDENPNWGTRLQCAEYQQRPPKVTIYSLAMEKLAKYAEENQIDAFRDPITLRNISLAHELYHHLERTQCPNSSKKYYRSNQFKIGPISFKNKDLCLDEIAAHAFSQSFNELKINPAILNLLLRFRTTEERINLLKVAEEINESVGIA